MTEHEIQPPVTQPPTQPKGTWVRFDVSGQVTSDAQALQLKTALSMALSDFPALHLSMQLVER